MISEPFPVLNAQILKTLGFALFQERSGAQEFIVLTSYVDFCDYFLAISVDSFDSYDLFCWWVGGPRQQVVQ